MPAIIAGKVPKMMGPTLARDNHHEIPSRHKQTHATATLLLHLFRL